MPATLETRSNRAAHLGMGLRQYRALLDLALLVDRDEPVRRIEAEDEGEEEHEVEPGQRYRCVFRIDAEEARRLLEREGQLLALEEHRDGAADRRDRGRDARDEGVDR